MCLATQSCPTLCHPLDHSLPDSSVHGIFQARILEWIAISFSGSNLHLLCLVPCRCILYPRNHQGSLISYKKKDRRSISQFFIKFSPSHKSAFSDLLSFFFFLVKLFAVPYHVFFFFLLSLPKSCKDFQSFLQVNFLINTPISIALSCYIRL